MPYRIATVPESSGYEGLIIALREKKEADLLRDTIRSRYRDQAAEIMGLLGLPNNEDFEFYHTETPTGRFKAIKKWFGTKLYTVDSFGRILLSQKTVHADYSYCITWTDELFNAFTVAVQKSLGKKIG